MLQAHFADVFRVSIESLRQDTDAVYARLAVFLFGSAATPSFQASLAHFASSQQALARSCHHWSGCHASSTNQSTKNAQERFLQEDPILGPVLRGLRETYLAFPRES